jgi:hypothetical protein
MLHCVVWWILTNISEELTAPIIRVTHNLIIEAVKVKVKLFHYTP